MTQYEQCYFRDSGMLFAERTYTVEEPGTPFIEEDWFDSDVFVITEFAIDFPDGWSSRPWFVIPGLSQIIDSKTNGSTDHPYLRALKSQFSQVDWEAIEDKIEGAGGLKAAIAALDIGRLGRRVKALYLAGKITAAQALKIKTVFQHLTDQFD